ncbi:SDR family oxidoreductase [Sneathiella litorea]|nr:SDR family oxidoreductase [Sneathiella litorea]
MRYFGKAIDIIKERFSFMRLLNKRAIVTGAGSGIGAAISCHFAKQGAKVAVVDINLEKAEVVANKICVDGGEAVPFYADVSNSDDVANAFAGAEMAFSGLEIIVNCAGINQKLTACTEVSEETFDRMFNVNVKSLYFTTLHGVPILAKYERCAIVNIGSVGGIRPRAGMAWYGASKAAVNAYSAALALELAPQRIRVNSIAPVRTDTPMVWYMVDGETVEKRAKMDSEIPLGRIGHVDDIAQAAVYLASDEASFVTGQTLAVDGGRLLL